MGYKKRFYSLDILKVFATIFIIFHHYQQVSNVSYQNHINFFGGRLNFGYMVELFFVLSGFFMVSYIKKIKNGLSLKNFYLKRIQRLLPLVCISAIVYEILIYIYERIYYRTWFFNVHPSLWGIIIDSMGIQDGWVFKNPYVNNPTWYISVLLLCYIVFYFITYHCKKTKIENYAYLGMIFLGCGIKTYVINLPFFNASTCRGFYAFFTGVLLSVYIQNRKITKKEILSAMTMSTIIIYSIIFYPDFVSNDLVYLLTFILYPSIIILLCTDTMKKLFSNPLWGKLAGISFNAFIWHLPVYVAISICIKLFSINVDVSKVTNMYYYCIAVEIIGILSYFFIEKPLQKKIDRKDVSRSGDDLLPLSRP